VDECWPPPSDPPLIVLVTRRPLLSIFVSDRLKVFFPPRPRAEYILLAASYYDAKGRVDNARNVAG